MLMIMRLAQLDMNLLIALDALMAEASVTRAARRLGVSQPAMSQKLKRLREALDDPLFVSGPRGLAPTPKAERLAQPLHRLLGELEDVVLGEAEFDPRSATRRFVVAGSDLFELVNLPQILSYLAEHAPGVGLSSVPRSPALFDELERGQVDFVIGPSFLERPGIRRFKLGEDGFVVIARPGHPLTRGRFTLKKYLRARHVIVSPGGQPGTFVDRALAAQGLRRTISAQVASFLAAPFTVASSDYLATIPTQLAGVLASTIELEQRALPFELPAVVAYLAWHERFERDPGHRWFRALARRFRTEGLR